MDSVENKNSNLEGNNMVNENNNIDGGIVSQDMSTANNVENIIPNVDSSMNGNVNNINNGVNNSMNDNSFNTMNGMNNGGYNPVNSGMPNQVNGSMAKSNFSNKKLFIFGGIGLVLIFLIFTMVSSNKNLYCSKTEDVSGMELISEFTVESKGHKVVSVKLLMTADLGYFSSYRKSFRDSLDDEFKDYEYEGIDVDIWDNGNDFVYVELTADEDSYARMGYISADTLKEIKEDFEHDGYVCYEE